GRTGGRIEHVVEPRSIGGPLWGRAGGRVMRHLGGSGRFERTSEDLKNAIDRGDVSDAVALRRPGRHSLDLGFGRERRKRGELGSGYGHKQSRGDDGDESEGQRGT